MDTQLFRVSIRLKEPDKRKNASVFHYVVMAETLDGAKALAVAKWVDPAEYYSTHRLENIAAVKGTAMETLVYNSDIRSSKDKSVEPETVPDAVTVATARALVESFERAHETADVV